MTKELTASRAFDHLVIGVADLEAGVAWFEAVTGVRPAYGGRHRELGTQNALAALEADSYLELLAPVPGHASDIAAALAALTAPRPVTWAVRCHDALATAAALSQSGVAAAASAHERRTPGGELISWDVVMLTHGLGPVVPFLIDWKDASGPARTAPAGCELVDMVVQHPDPDAVRRILADLAIDQPVVHDDVPGLRVRLRSPRGIVELGP